MKVCFLGELAFLGDVLAGDEYRNALTLVLT